MDKKASPNAKAGLKVAQTGTPVPAKDFSSSKKEAKAAGPSSKGSMGKAASLPTESASSTPVPTEAKKWENSSEDMMQDYRAAKRKGISASEYEGSASDRISDTAGEKRMREADSKDGNKEIDHPTGYKKGISAFSNSPKVSHGFGHPPAARDGHLRMSGHSGGHRIGKKK
jgi:hypothetical protein